MREAHPGIVVLAHPECKPSVVAKEDRIGSTTEMVQYVLERKRSGTPFLLLTECGVASRLSVEAPEAKLVGGCTLCKYMRSNSLSSIAQALEDPRPTQIVEIAPSALEKARKCIERMFEYAE